MQQVIWMKLFPRWCEKRIFHFAQSEYISIDYHRHPGDTIAHTVHTCIHIYTVCPLDSTLAYTPPSCQGPPFSLQVWRNQRWGGAPHCSHHCSGISPLDSDGQALPQVGERLGFAGDLFDLQEDYYSVSKSFTILLFFHEEAFWTWRRLFITQSQC